MYVCMCILAHFFLDYEYEGMVNVWIHIIREDENQIYTPHDDIFMEFLIISLVFWFHVDL